MNAVQQNGSHLGYRGRVSGMQCNRMGQAWVTKDGYHECSVTEWFTPGLLRMGIRNAVQQNGSSMGYQGWVS